MEAELKTTKAANEALQQRCQQLEAQLAAKE
jgi:BMFP domain-containing protein YqiC